MPPIVDIEPNIGEAEPNLEDDDEPPASLPTISLSKSFSCSSTPTPTPNSPSEANVQLPLVVGVLSPSSVAAWKSPKSPNDSNEESSSENEELNVNASAPPVAAESEKGPKPS
jgi:hypothetical protein